MRVYFDMDGVLTRFDDYLISNAQPQDTRSETIYKLTNALGDKKVFSSLEPNRINEMKKLMRDLKRNGHEIQILTSLGTTDPKKCIGRYEGKLGWMLKYYGDLLERKIITKINVVVTCEQKQYYANQNSFLIDDQFENVTQFISNGGKAIVYEMVDHEYSITRINLEIQAP